MTAGRMILSVPWGPEAGLKVALTPGKALRVGRTERSDVVIASDTDLSAVHFELKWDGALCHLRDLNSAKGVRVGGEATKEADLGHGAWIRAGGTDFRLFVEGGLAKPLADLDEDDDDDEAARKAKVRAREKEERARGRRAAALETLLLVSRQERLHAILDAARDPRVLELLTCSIDQARSLYEGPKAESFTEIAPYLVRFTPGSPLLEKLVMEGWGERWGVYLTSIQSYKELRRHFRRFLKVEDADTGEELFFRFYDPEVLRVFLPSCLPRQAAEFWSDVDSFLLEDREGNLVRSERAQALAAATEQAR